MLWCSPPNVVSAVGPEETSGVPHCFLLCALRHAIVRGIYKVWGFNDLPYFLSLSKTLTNWKNLTVGSGFGSDEQKSSLRLLNLLHIVSFPLEYPQTLSTVRSRLSKNARACEQISLPSKYLNIHIYLNTYTYWIDTCMLIFAYVW